jgi:hypothetical protein
MGLGTSSIDLNSPDVTFSFNKEIALDLPPPEFTSPLPEAPDFAAPPIPFPDPVATPEVLPTPAPLFGETRSRPEDLLKDPNTKVSFSDALKLPDDVSPESLALQKQSKPFTIAPDTKFVAQPVPAYFQDLLKPAKPASSSDVEPTRRLAGAEASAFASDAKSLGRLLRQDRSLRSSSRALDGRKPDPVRVASVNVRGGPFFAGVGARNQAVGLNWAVAGVDLVGLGRGGANVLQGKGIGQDTRIPVQAYVEGNIDQLPGFLGQAIGALTKNSPNRAESDVAVLVRATLKGDKNGNLDVDSVIAVPILDVAKKDGLFGAGLNKGASTGAVVFEWARNTKGEFELLPGVSATSFDVLGKKLKDTKNKESAEVALPVDALGITGRFFGWTQTNRPGIGAADGAAPGIFQVAADNLANKQYKDSGRRVFPRGTDNFGKLAVAGLAVDAVGKDIVRSLDGTVAKNADGQFFSRTLTGLGRFIISPSVPGAGVYIEPRASVEFVQDGRRDVNVFAGNEKKPLFSVKEEDFSRFGNRIIELLQKIPRLPAPSRDNATPR